MWQGLANLPLILLLLPPGHVANLYFPASFAEKFGHIGSSRQSNGADPQDERGVGPHVNVGNSSYIQILLEEYMNFIGLIH